ncbi:hypothetical protein Godav_013354 [Gossypium davidsonii]|uniref:DUF7745 domain-containing protein n=1 Tax=Gossypium davidsonii TaxID=34287 RepID=A0A7J8RG71_GOSDV|nr:hypothetical protein [Gossypium davidsonii]
MNITGMSEQWVTAQIKQKGESKCIPRKSLRDLILAHPDTKKKVDVFALSIYGLIIFPKALGHIDEAVSDLFDRLDRRVTPVPVILAEAFRSLSTCQRTGEGRFIGCAQLLLAWDFDWVPLLGISGAIGYTPLLVLRQYRSRQFILVTQGLTQCECSYKRDNYKKKIREMSNAWKKIHRMKRFDVGSMTTPKYYGWRSKRVNDNIPEPKLGASLSKIEEMKRRVEELEAALQNCETRIELLEASEERQKEQLHFFRTKLEIEITLWEKLWLRFGR